MSQFYKRIKIAILVLFIPSTIFTAFVLFSIQDDLITNIPQLNTDDIPALAIVLANLQIAAGITLILSLISLLLNFVASSEPRYDTTKNPQASLSSKLENNITEEAEHKEEIDQAILIDLSKKHTGKSELYSNMLSAICNQIEVGIGAIYLVEENKKAKSVVLQSSYAMNLSSEDSISFEIGEGLVGQVAKEGKAINIDDVPDNYIDIVSGLGNSSPNHILITPILKGKKVFGVVELASFHSFTDREINFINKGISLLTSTSSNNSKKNSKLSQ